jgi:pimeloyl-ACP methyl ester carboxylesterase
MKQMIFTQLKGQVNVVVVDWHKASKDVYPRSASSTQTAGKSLAEFILSLRNIYPIDSDRVHLIGHSLGAHLSAFAGKHLAQRNVTIGQITGELR